MITPVRSKTVMPVARSKLRNWLGLISWSTAISCRSSVSAGVFVFVFVFVAGDGLARLDGFATNTRFVLHPLHFHACVARAAGECSQLDQLAFAQDSRGGERAAGLRDSSHHAITQCFPQALELVEARLELGLGHAGQTHADEQRLGKGREG